MSETTAPPVVEGVEWVRPRPPRAASRNDVVLALVLAAGTAASVVLYRITGWGEGAPWWGSVIWVAAMNLPLAARRRWPEIVALVASVAFVVGAMAEVGEALFSNIALFIAIYTVGAWGRSRLRANVVRGVIVVGMFVWLFWGLIVGSLSPDQLPDMSREGVISPYLAFGLINVVTNLLYFGGAWYFGDAAYRSARSRAELEQRTTELAAERERTRVQAVAIERLRIARELHDVVAHHVSVIGVQAGAARRVIARDPDAAAASLSAIESSAREAVDELHGLLGTLRGDTGPTAVVADDAEPATTSTSTRGIDRIDELVAESVAAGLPTELAIVGRRTPGFAPHRPERLPHRPGGAHQRPQACGCGGHRRSAGALVGCRGRGRGDEHRCRAGRPRHGRSAGRRMVRRRRARPARHARARRRGRRHHRARATRARRLPRAGHVPAASRRGGPRVIRVLVVDDQALVRGGFRTILDSEDGIEVVGEAADGAAAVAAVAELAPDVVCMDVQMPGMDGLEATRRITADAASAAAVLVLTTFNREDYLFAALEAGASGFLLKNSSPEQLIEAVQVVARGDALLSPDVTRRVIEAVAASAGRGAAQPRLETPPDPSAGRGAAQPRLETPPGAQRPAAQPAELSTLTDREREVLELLAEGISNAEIAQRMWVGEATVKTHVSKVLMKLGLRDRVHAVVYAYEHGVVRPAS